MYKSVIRTIPDLDLFLADYKKYCDECELEGIEAVSLIEFAEDAEHELKLQVDYLAY